MKKIHSNEKTMNEYQEYLGLTAKLFPKETNLPQDDPSVVRFNELSKKFDKPGVQSNNSTASDGNSGSNSHFDSCPRFVKFMFIIFIFWLGLEIGKSVGVVITHNEAISAGAAKIGSDPSGGERFYWNVNPEQNK